MVSELGIICRVDMVLIIVSARRVLFDRFSRGPLPRLVEHSTGQYERRSGKQWLFSWANNGSNCQGRIWRPPGACSQMGI